MKSRGWKPAVLAATSAVLTGCGWTPRDDYLYNEKQTVSARAGDGSTRASDFKSSRARQTAGVASRFEDQN